MQIIGIHGKRGAGKTVVSGFLTAELADLGFTVKVDSAILSLRRRAREEGWLDKEEHRGEYQRVADIMRKPSPNYFLNDLFLRNNMDAATREQCSNKWEPADFLIIHDVRLENEVRFCRYHGVVIHIQGTHDALTGPESEHETELQAGDLFYGADHIITQQPSLEHLHAVVRAMVAAGKHLKVQ
ncbi:MAG: hypothetical protein LUE17_05850 [Planctomycetaceae bacterium]|nr:hypothetical protein [Planctomycetaceae bacterium]